MASEELTGDVIPTDVARVLYEGDDATRRVDRWTRHLMRGECESGGAFEDTATLREAGQWPAFVRELFGELYGLGVAPLEQPAVGSRWISEVLEQAQQLPEWRELCERSAGDPWRCGLGAAAAATALSEALSEALDQLPEQDPAQAQAAAADAHALLEQLANQQAAAEAAAKQSGDYTDADALDRACKRQAKVAADAQALAEAAATAADSAAQELRQQGTRLRGVLRQAADYANGELDEMDDAMAGLGHGTSAGALTSVKAPSEKVQQALRANPELRRIAAIAGRLRLSAKRQQASKCEHGREEVCDVEQGDDLQRLLPSELALLMDVDLELLAMRKLVERQAMQYRLRGREQAERGPIVVMLDGSASMRGARHEWAMGVALAMLEVAAMQGRSLAVVHYGSQVLKHDVIANPRGLSLERVIELVTFEASSGTNIQGCLDWVGRELVGGEACLKGADVLLVSDGESGDFSGNVNRLRDDYGAVTYGLAIQADWRGCNQAALEDYYLVTDAQIREGSERIDGVLAL